MTKKALRVVVVVGAAVAAIAGAVPAGAAPLNSCDSQHQSAELVHIINGVGLVYGQLVGAQASAGGEKFGVNGAANSGLSASCNG